MPHKGQDIRTVVRKDHDIVFDKTVFSSVFYKDIRRAYIYKKAERLASALYLITPALQDSLSLKTEIEETALKLAEAARLPHARLNDALSREILALSSLLSMAEAGGLLSPMNAGLVLREARLLLEEVTQYEEPRLTLPESPAPPALGRQASGVWNARASVPASSTHKPAIDKGHLSNRQQGIMSFIREKGTVSIKDLARIVPGVSEKTIQRELGSLIEDGKIVKRGERRWSSYSLAP